MVTIYTFLLLFCCFGCYKGEKPAVMGSVSYTHLDVYKRQAHTGAEGGAADIAVYECRLGFLAADDGHLLFEYACGIVLSLIHIYIVHKFTIIFVKTYCAQCVFLFAGVYA